MLSSHSIKYLFPFSSKICRAEYSVSDPVDFCDADGLSVPSLVVFTFVVELFLLRLL